MLKVVYALVVGLFLAVLMSSFVDSLGNVLFGPGSVRPEAAWDFRAHLDEAPLGADLLLIASSLVGALAGGPAVIIGRRRWLAYVPGVAVALRAVLIAVAFAVPVWVTVSSVLLALATAHWFGKRLGIYLAAISGSRNPGNAGAASDRS